MGRVLPDDGVSPQGGDPAAGPAATPGRAAPRRPRRYGRELLPLLERVWRASDCLSGKLSPSYPAPRWPWSSSMASWCRQPGALQGDLVLLSGESTAGFLLATLVAVAVAPTWTELQAVWGRHHRRVTSGIHILRQRLPVSLRAWHRDNGGSNGEIFYSLTDAQIVIEQWRVQDNTGRSHASLGWRPPITPSSRHNAIPQSLVVM